MQKFSYTANLTNQRVFISFPNNIVSGQVGGELHGGNVARALNNNIRIAIEFLPRAACAGTCYCTHQTKIKLELIEMFSPYTTFTLNLIINSFTNSNSGVLERNLQLDNRLLDRYLLIQDHRHGEIPGGLIWIEVKRRRDTCITFCIQGASVSAIPGAMLTPRRCRATREEWILEFVIFLAFLYWACDPHEITRKRAERGHVSSLIARSRTYHSV